MRFLYFGAKPLMALSVGQKTVKPPSTFSLKAGSALEPLKRSANALQPCLDIMEIRSMAEGAAVGASASAELMAALIWRTEM